VNKSAKVVLAEQQEFGTYIKDDAVLARACNELGFNPSTSWLEMLRDKARDLVIRERLTIQVLAEKLLRRGSMTGDEITLLLS